MATAKTTAPTFPIEPGLREALLTAAHREHRSNADMMEIINRVAEIRYIPARAFAALHHMITH